MRATNGREKRLVPIVETQNCFTTKDTKSTKESEDEAFDPAFKPEVTLKFIKSPVFTPASILRVLRALRGEFSLVATHSKRQRT